MRRTSLAIWHLPPQCLVHHQLRWSAICKTPSSALSLSLALNVRLPCGPTLSPSICRLRSQFTCLLLSVLFFSFSFSLSSFILKLPNFYCTHLCFFYLSFLFDKIQSFWLCAAFASFFFLLLLQQLQTVEIGIILAVAVVVSLIRMTAAVVSRASVQATDDDTS